MRLAPELERAVLDRSLVAALWTIGCTIRNWALHPNGILHRNTLISPEDRLWLDDGTKCFDTAVALLLQGAGREAAEGSWIEP